jgi:hypothetical protein
MFGFGYTWAKSMDNVSNYRDIMPDTYNTTNLWGPSEYDARNAAVVNYLYVLPFMRNQTTLTSKILGGWRLSGSAQFQTGQPCGVGTNNDNCWRRRSWQLRVWHQYVRGSILGKEWKPRTLKQFAGPGSTAQYISTKNFDGTPIFIAPPSDTFNLQRGRARFNLWTGLPELESIPAQEFPHQRTVAVRIQHGCI